MGLLGPNLILQESSASVVCYYFTRLAAVILTRLSSELVRRGTCGVGTEGESTPIRGTTLRRAHLLPCIQFLR